MKKVFLLMAVALPLVFISCDKDEPVPLDNHEYVDLGLPSGTLWATCNVGADKPEEFGDYFAWGETTPKGIYVWNTYLWGGYDSIGNFYLSKYNTDSGFGPFDGKRELELKDDAAYANWGALWRMPSYDQLEELYNNCTWRWTQRNGVDGYLGTGPNGKTLFLPAAGFRWNDSLILADGIYWSRTLSPSLTVGALCYGFDSEYSNKWNINGRGYGQTVRAVRVSKK